MGRDSRIGLRRSNPHCPGSLVNDAESERLTRLEERYAHLQRHQAEQDKAMLELTEELARLQKELAALRAQQSGGAGPMEAADADERPPHY
jgi:SlyX protein